MNPFYSLCDVLICRAGGSTLAEALSWGIPAVVVPWERAAEGHQERNARCFEEAGGGDRMEGERRRAFGKSAREAARKRKRRCGWGSGCLLRPSRAPSPLGICREYVEEAVWYNTPDVRGISGGLCGRKLNGTRRGNRFGAL